MWDIPPDNLCNQHLLGEHVEMHMFAGTIEKGISIAGYISKGLVNPNKIRERHDILAKEMTARGMNHKSELSFISSNLPVVFIDRRKNKRDLKQRCKNCAKRIKK